MKVTVQTALEEDELNILRAMAEAHSLTLSSLLRTAVREYLVKRGLIEEEDVVLGVWSREDR